MIFNLGGYDNPAASLPSFTYSGTYQLVDDGSSDGISTALPAEWAGH